MSVVVPFLNESDGILEYCRTMDEHAAVCGFPLELVFVDDGSTDDSVDLLSGYRFSNIKDVQLIKLSHNFGSHAAIRAGLSYAKYDICTWMGSDLQEPIEFLAQSYKLITQEKYNAVYIEKESVEVSTFNRLFSKAYSWMMRKYAVKNYSSGGIANIVFDRKIKRYLIENNEANSSIMLQIIDAGFRFKNLSMAYHGRNAGVSKWTLGKKIKLLIDSFVSFSFMPIRLVSIMGVLMMALGCVFAVIVLVNAIYTSAAVSGYATLAILLSFGFGITNISLGIVAEYLWRAYDAARGRPCYIVDEAIVIERQCDTDGE